MRRNTLLAVVVEQGRATRMRREQRDSGRAGERKKRSSGLRRRVGPHQRSFNGNLRYIPWFSAPAVATITAAVTSVKQAPIGVEQSSGHSCQSARERLRCAWRGRSHQPLCAPGLLPHVMALLRPRTPPRCPPRPGQGCRSHCSQCSLRAPWALDWVM